MELMKIREVPGSITLEFFDALLKDDDAAPLPYFWDKDTIENALADALKKAWNKGFDSGRYPLSGPQNDEPTREELLNIEISLP